jgi:hypothetical protein
MKKIFLIIAFFAITVSANAQAPTFEKTVTYINDFLIENPGIRFSVGNSRETSINMMKAKKDGKVIFLWKNTVDASEEVIGSFNLHNVKYYEFSGVNPNGTSRLHIYFSEKKASNESACFGTYITKTMSEKLEKMLRHLTTLCTEKDPFGS